MKETNNLELVQRVKDGMQRCLATAMSRRGLDEVLPSYGDVLCLLRLMGTPVPVSDLVTTLRRPKSTITKATDFLAREGLLRKRPNPGDGRSILVELTESGAAFADSFEEARKSVGEMMFQALPVRPERNSSTCWRKLTLIFMDITAETSDLPDVSVRRLPPQERAGAACRRFRGDTRDRRTFLFLLFHLPGIIRPNPE